MTPSEALNQIKKSNGLGSAIAAVTTAIGIKPCSGCKKRAEYLDEKFPFKKDDRDITRK